MDVHVRNSYLHATDETGTLQRRGRCANRLADLAEFLRVFEGDQVRVSLESTTNSRAIHRMLNDCAVEMGLDLSAQVLDARKLRIIAESVTKNDRFDAAVLAELTRADLKLPTCYLPDDQEFTLREHLRARHDLVALRTRIKNRIHSVLHRRGVLVPLKGSLFSSLGRTYLAQTELDEAGRAIVNRYIEILDQLEEAIASSTTQLRELSRRPRWAKPMALLTSMPGVGLITALTILAELGNINRFRSRAAVANYVGLVPVLRSSNDKSCSGHITKRGSKHLRAVLIEAAWEGVRRVPKYQMIFERIATRRGRKIAIVAMARRMLEDAWTMLKKDEAFRMTLSVAG
jgi:transposase